MAKEERRRGETTNRRDFLKVSGATAGAAAVVGANQQTVLHSLVNAEEQRNTADDTEQIFYSVCHPNCNGHCHLNVHVRNGKVVKISQGSFPDSRYNRICPRGLSQIQRVYGAERLKYPMKRSGERGENKWERISWDEAINTIVDKFAAIQEQYGEKSLFFFAMGANCSILNGNFPGSEFRFQNCIKGVQLTSATDSGWFPGIYRVYGSSTQLYGDQNDLPDIVNAKQIFVWGTNITVAYGHTWHFIADAIENGTKVTVIDPNFTGMASKAHRHVSLRAGTDSALMMSMMNVIIEEKLYDTEFLLAHTVAPLLVRKDTKKFLRMSDLGVEPISIETEEASGPSAQSQISGVAGTSGAKVIDPYVVWDLATKKAVAVDDATDPALEGTFEVLGIEVSTAFSLLKERVSEFTPEKGALLTDVAPDMIQTLARDFATIKPTASFWGFAGNAYDNAPRWGHAYSTLNALTGNVGKPGTGSHVFWQSFLNENFGFTFPDGINADTPTFPYHYLRELVEKGKYTIRNCDFVPPKALWIAKSNFLANLMGAKWLREEFWPTLDFIVVVDERMTETALMADMVLPVAHQFECEDVFPAGATHPYIQYCEPAIEPYFESLVENEIYRRLANKMGVGKYFAASDSEMLKEALETPEGIAMGVTYENLRDKKAIRFKEEGHIGYAGYKFNTPSGRMEFYCEDPKDNLGRSVPKEKFLEECLPAWTPPTEAWIENPLYEKYPLVLMFEKPKFRAHTSWSQTPWLREIDPEPFIKVNPKTAAARGVKQGDYVEVFNDLGSVVLKAVLSEGIRPDCISHPRGWERFQYKSNTSFQDLLSGHYDVVGINSSFMDILVDFRKA